MPSFDERAELAPRDIVARAIDFEMKRLGADCMYLDISHKSPEFIKQHFPTIYEKTMSLGIDMTNSPIPIVWRPLRFYFIDQAIPCTEVFQDKLVAIYSR